MSRKNLKIAQDERGERVFSLDLKKIKELKNAHKEFLPQRKMEVIKKERKRCSRVTSPPHTYYTHINSGLYCSSKATEIFSLNKRRQYERAGRRNLIVVDEKNLTTL